MRRLIRLLILVSVLAASTAAGPATDAVLPDTPMGRLASRWITAFGGSDADMRAFLERDALPSGRPMEERVARLKPMRAAHGALTPVRVLAATPDRIVVLTRDAHGAWLEVTLEGSGGEAPKLGGIGLNLATGDEQPKDMSPMTEAAMRDSVRALFAERAGQDRFSGVVRVERAGRVVFETARGLADRETGAAIDLDTRFNLGSINKLVTRLVILELVEQGRLALSDRLSRHLPDYPRDKADRITIEQLLEMTSGLGDVFGPRYDAADKSTLRNPRDWFPLFVDRPLEFEPGSSRRYSNAGYIVLGAVAEAITGQSYYDLVRDWVYRPAGMTRSDSYPRDGKTPNLAIGYTRGPLGERDHHEDATPDLSEPLRPSTDWLGWRGSPAGGGYSTAADLSRLVSALGEGRILRPETVTKYFGGRPGSAPGRTPRRASLELGIAGGAPGCNAALEVEGEWTVIVLANLDPPAATDVGQRIRRWIERVPAAGPAAREAR